MKLILAGATGFIGNEVLTQALSHPKVTSVVALSRRPLTGPLSSHPKLQTALMTDETYISYPPEVLSQLADASGAVWALGIAFPKEQEIYRRVNVDYTKAAAQTLGKMASEGSMAEGRFRFAYCSGALPERDQEKKLWFLEEGRKLRGSAENEVVQAGEDWRDAMDTFVLKPAYVLSRHAGYLNTVAGSTLTIRVQDLAAALLQSAVEGNDMQIEQSSSAAARGRRFFERNVKA
ncbi:MAG: hypothetical protein MMC23_009421 [Stictis urceolatum]|nr:hypothetical protein [Stictis urceolata]